MKHHKTYPQVYDSHSPGNSENTKQDKYPKACNAGCYKSSCHKAKAKTKMFKGLRGKKQIQRNTDKSNSGILIRKQTCKKRAEVSKVLKEQTPT